MMNNTGKYEWKYRVLSGVAAEDVGLELEKISRANGGELTPKMVVTAASPKRSLLHNAFEWDDKIAADAHRIDQAKLLIRNVMIVHETNDGEDHQVRGFVSIKDDDGHAAYHTLATAMSDEEKRMKVLAKALKELKSWTAKYRDFQELARIFDAVDDLKIA